jgi:hypothetical protein
MGSCASVHKDDVGLPQKLLHASSPPPKNGAVDGKGGAPVGDVLVDLKRKIEEQGGFGYSKSHDSGTAVHPSPPGPPPPLLLPKRSSDCCGLDHQSDKVSRIYRIIHMGSRFFMWKKGPFGFLYGLLLLGSAFEDLIAKDTGVQF